MKKASTFGRVSLFSSNTKTTTKRQIIEIDENNDTLPNVDAFSKAIERGKRLKDRMEEAIGDDAWEKLHGPHEVPKKYVPPFLRQDML